LYVIGEFGKERKMSLKAAPFLLGATLPDFPPRTLSKATNILAHDACNVTCTLFNKKGDLQFTRLASFWP
jgi:hypothetical protein